MGQPRSSDHNPPPPPPGRDPSLILLVAALVPISLSIAATVTSIWGQDPVVSRTAWIVVAVVGTATMVSAAVSTRPHGKVRHDRSHQDELKDSKPE